MDIKLALKRVLTLIKWIGLIIFALTILLFTPICFILGLFPIFFKTKIGPALDKLAMDFRVTAYTLDVLGNVTIFNWLWFIFKTKDGYKFGNSGETVSVVLKRNYDMETLWGLGYPLYNIINRLDPGHFNNL